MYALVSSMSFGHEDLDMKIVHEQMKNYLKFEEEAMESRIRYVCALCTYVHVEYKVCAYIYAICMAMPLFI